MFVHCETPWQFLLPVRHHHIVFVHCETPWHSVCSLWDTIAYCLFTVKHHECCLWDTMTSCLFTVRHHDIVFVYCETQRHSVCCLWDTHQINSTLNHSEKRVMNCNATWLQQSFTISILGHNDTHCTRGHWHCVCSLWDTCQINSTLNHLDKLVMNCYAMQLDSNNH